MNPVKAVYLLPLTKQDWQWIRKNDNMVIDVAALVNALSGN